MKKRFGGLIPAVFTPMFPDGSVNLEQISPIVEHLVREGVSGIYICGSTGEGPSLTIEERMATAERYVQSARGRLFSIVQVGHDSLAEASKLAAHAARVGADAISAVPPTYFKYQSIDSLIEGMKVISEAAPGLPFFYYHIPALSSIHLDMVEFLRLGAARLPSLAGIKFSSPALDEYQRCVDIAGDRFSILYGVDEMLLSALVVGAQGAVGSTYNYVAPLNHAIIDAFQTGDLEKARHLQGIAVELIRVQKDFGGLPAIKSMMRLIGYDCGPTRLPHIALQPDEVERLRVAVEEVGFGRWVTPSGSNVETATS